MIDSIDWNAFATTRNAGYKSQMSVCCLDTTDHALKQIRSHSIYPIQTVDYTSRTYDFDSKNVRVKICADVHRVLLSLNHVVIQLEDIQYYDFSDDDPNHDSESDSDANDGRDADEYDYKAHFSHSFLLYQQNGLFYILHSYIGVFPVTISHIPDILVFFIDLRKFLKSPSTRVSMFWEKYFNDFPDTTNIKDMLVRVMYVPKSEGKTKTLRKQMFNLPTTTVTQTTEH
jgi:hypothetical protein